MKRIFSAVLLLIMAGGMAPAQKNVPCTQWKLSETYLLTMPAFADRPSVDGKEFDLAALLESAQANAEGARNWQEIIMGNDSLIATVKGKDRLLQLAGFLKSDRWTKATMTVSTNAIYELYLDGSKIKTQSKPSDKPVKIDFVADNGIHEVLLKMLTTGDSLRLAAGVAPAGKDGNAVLGWSSDPQRMVTIHDILDGEEVAGASLSPSGKYLLLRINEVLPGTGKTLSHFRIYDMELKKNVTALRDVSLRADWLPSTDRLCYQERKDNVSDIYVYDVQGGTETLVARALKSPGRITWSPDESYFVFTRTDEAAKTGDLKRVFDNDDRIPGTRDRSYLCCYDLKTNLERQLTAGNESASLQDVKPDGTKILFSVSRTDYSEVPFSKQDLFEMDIRTMQLDTVWKDKPYGGYCQYSPDGTQLLVSGGPETFGETGVKVGEGRIPNSYDTQLFLFDLKEKKSTALTRDFDPAVNRAYWSQEGPVYLTAVERDYVNLYRLDIKKQSFSRIDVPVEVIGSVNYAANKPLAVYDGSSVSTPQKLYAIDLKSGKSALLFYPKDQRMKEVVFGSSEDWNFVNGSGTTIYGRIYYPVGYDPSKKYPVIVNYYGGTTPTDRSFGGRYPKNVWAAGGYIVYVVQPSGSTGFGQDFSALHVNGWGRDAIDDIIEGTKLFLRAHPSADAENVGCIGASYGGFTTMMLQTRTDIFKTAIAHAGISDITSYWGEGYWGYSYSTGATKDSYPWNRRDIYVDNSPLFNADKFHNSILLLHGTSDTNVPVGESLQFYAALKILGKNVEMVLINGENHHILDYKKRIEWHNTIMAWFDKMLKNQPAHWNEMYPEKNL
jgi:dipeptidyl aminopeptidase/acylaminoacyl peptidase